MCAWGSRPDHSDPGLEMVSRGRGRHTYSCAGPAPATSCAAPGARAKPTNQRCTHTLHVPCPPLLLVWVGASSLLQGPRASFCHSNSPLATAIYVLVQTAQTAGMGACCKNVYCCAVQIRPYFFFYETKLINDHVVYRKKSQAVRQAGAQKAESVPHRKYQHSCPVPQRDRGLMSHCVP